MWPDRRVLDLFKIELPILKRRWRSQRLAMAIAVCGAGGLGSLPCAMLDIAKSFASRTRRHPAATSQPIASISSATRRQA